VKAARILSLMPEATQILQALGLGDQVVRVPRSDGQGAATWGAGECVAPDALAAARPTLIFTSATHAGGEVPRPLVRKLVARLRPRPAVYALEPHTLGDILSDIKTVGDATGQQAAARALILALRTRIDAVTLRSARVLASGYAPRVACLAGTAANGEPLAAGWWLAELVGLAGGVDVLHGSGRPPRAVTWAEVLAARPDQLWTIDASPCVDGLGASVAERWVSRSVPPLPLPPADKLTASPVVMADASAGASVWPVPGAVDTLEQFAAWCGAECAGTGPNGGRRAH
jgi:iron complex transport system substrate-binding protein